MESLASSMTPGGPDQAGEPAVDKTELAWLAARIHDNEVRLADFRTDDYLAMPVSGGELLAGTPFAQLQGVLAALCRRPWTALEMQVSWSRSDIMVQARALHGEADHVREERLPISDAVAHAAFALKARYLAHAAAVDSCTLRLHLDANGRFDLCSLHARAQPPAPATGAADAAIVATDPAAQSATDSTNGSPPAACRP